VNGSSDQDTGLRILDVAEEILERVGEPNLRVADVAEKCGIAIGLIYHYYRDRSALVAAVRLRQYTRLPYFLQHNTTRCFAKLFAHRNNN